MEAPASAPAPQAASLQDDAVAFLQQRQMPISTQSVNEAMGYLQRNPEQRPSMDKGVDQDAVNEAFHNMGGQGNLTTQRDAQGVMNAKPATAPSADEEDALQSKLDTLDGRTGSAGQSSAAASAVDDAGASGAGADKSAQSADGAGGTGTMSKLAPLLPIVGVLAALLMRGKGGAANIASKLEPFMRGDAEAAQQGSRSLAAPPERLALPAPAIRMPDETSGPQINMPPPIPSTTPTLQQVLAAKLKLGQLRGQTAKSRALDAQRASDMEGGY